MHEKISAKNYQIQQPRHDPLAYNINKDGHTEIECIVLCWPIFVTEKYSTME